jgi:hypothetical protein
VLSVEKLQRTPDRIFHGHARLVFYRTGRQPVPVFGLPFMRAVKGLSRGMLPSDSAFVEVRSLVPAGNPPLKDIRELEPPPRQPLLPWILGLLLLAGAGLLTWWRSKRRPEQAAAAPEPAITPVSPALSPYDVALAQLARIEKEQWPRRGQVARHYEAAIDALRDYLEHDEEVPARERTTAELLWSLPPHLSNGGLRERFHRLLDEADLVKFARLEPDTRRAETFLTRCRELLEQWHLADAPELADAVR